jgi:hypothetical protein
MCRVLACQPGDLLEWVADESRSAADESPRVADESRSAADESRRAPHLSPND